MRTCYECYWKQQVTLAATMSTCITRQVGAVMVRGKRQVATGFNGNLPGAVHCTDGGCVRCNSPAKSPGQALDICVCCHAEENLVTYCAKDGVRTAETTVYVSYSPCLGCFRLLALAGVEEVVYEESYPANEALVRELAQQANVLLRNYNCSCGD